MEYGQKFLKYKGKIVFEKFGTPYFDRMPKEFFENEACFIFVNEGEFSVRTQDQYFNFKKGNSLIAKCLNYFFETNEDQRKSSEGIEVIGVLFYPDLVEELFQFDLSQSTHSFDFNVKQIEVDALLLNFKNSINILIDNPELADEMMIKTKLKEFVLLITKSVSAPSQLDFLAAMFKPNHSSLKEVVMNNIYSNLSLDEYAALCHMSTSTFKRQFKETFNSTPKKFINQQKLKKAIQLLGKEELRISDIAYECGFDSLATFNRLFKEEFSKSPTTYKLELN